MYLLLHPISRIPRIQLSSFDTPSQWTFLSCKLQ